MNEIARLQELTFEVVDDLVGAHTRGRLGVANPPVRYAPSSICPLIELMFEATNGRFGPLLRTRWLDHTTQNDLRTALAGNANIWLDQSRRRGFLRTVLSPSNPEDDVDRTRFLIAARTPADAAGFGTPVAQSLAAALREMESNIHEHSERPETGILSNRAEIDEISLSVVYATEKDRYGTVMTAVCNVLQPPSWSILLTSWKR